MRKLSFVAVVCVSALNLVSLPMARSSPRAESVPAARELVLNGEDWKLGSFEMDEGEKIGAFLPGFDDHAFERVVVPGEVQRQIGLRDMDLYFQGKTLTLVNKKEWWYRKEFTISKNQSGKLVRLIFDGVDYFTSVWLNGQKLGEHEGAYVSFFYDVTTKLRFGEVNVLAIKVTCPWIPKGRGFLEYMKGDWTTIDPQNQMHIHQAPFFFGPYWDGIPADGNAAFPMGIWRGVRLAISDSVIIEHLFVSTNSLNVDGSATLTISGSIENYSASEVKATLNLQVIPENFAGDSVSLPAQTTVLRPGENSVAMETVIKNAHLWWTWDTGQPNLYKLSSTLSTEKNSAGDALEVLFGIRTIAIKPDMSYWLNGKRLFLKGAWYPMSDYYGSKPTRETFLKDLQLFKAANLNHLVAFTVVEKPEFYELCDRLGILEIFEFPFNQDGPVDVLSFSNPRREAFVHESLRQVRQIILALRNHPSIIEWAAFAEAHAKGGGWGVGGWDFEQYGYGPYSEAIGKLVAELAPGTIYHASLCDMGEQHFWMGNAGMGNTDSYNQQFHAHTGFVSEYGSLSLPVLESWKKELTAENMWSDREKGLPRWHNLPIDISAYSYLSSFDYDGVASLLDRVNQYVDRHIRSIQDLVDDSQLYQAFLMRYSTESYRRKKYEPVNGTRFWDYGEVWPGIRWGIVDYFRVPKMSYYFLKQAQARFAVSLAYEEALESQPSGRPLQIPIWLLNDYPTELGVKVQCQIQDLTGHIVWSKEFEGLVPADGRKQIGTVEWTTPDVAEVYVLRAQASASDGQLQAAASAFIKVTPGLFVRPLRVLLIGQRKYSVPIAAMIQATGSKVDVIDERSLERLARLSDGAKVREDYDVVWLASFDSFWKFLDDRESEGLKESVRRGVGFIHTGGRGSFHGGFGEGACLDFTPLAEILPVNIKTRYDLILGQADQRTSMFSEFSPLKEIRLSDADKEEWTDSGLIAFGVLGFNETKLKPGAREVFSVAGHPLLAVGEYGKGHVLAFTGFTQAYSEEHAEWDSQVIYPYLLDQELYRGPATKAYFKLFMQLLAHGSGEKPQINYDSLISAREKPLFESLKDLPSAKVEMPQKAEATNEASDRFHFSFRLANHDRYARLLRVRAEWGKPTSAPYVVLFNDNYFDLAPGESRIIEGTALFPEGQIAPTSGKLIVEGTNVTRKDVMIRFVTEP